MTERALVGTVFRYVGSFIIAVALFGTYGLLGWCFVVGCWFGRKAMRTTLRADKLEGLDRKIAKLDALIAEDDAAHEVNRFRESLDDTLDWILRRDREGEA